MRHNARALLRRAKGHPVRGAPGMQLRLAATDRLEGLVVRTLPRKNAVGVQIVRVNDFRELRSSDGRARVREEKVPQWTSQHCAL
eukprot:6340974-Alexandrium_andersonii.AAC.1